MILTAIKYLCGASHFFAINASVKIMPGKKFEKQNLDWFYLTSLVTWQPIKESETNWPLTETFTIHFEGLPDVRSCPLCSMDWSKMFQENCLISLFLFKNILWGHLNIFNKKITVEVKTYIRYNEYPNINDIIRFESVD